jgi:hypothetical protein
LLRRSGPPLTPVKSPVAALGRTLLNFVHDLRGEAGNDDLRAGAAGSTLIGGNGLDRMVSGAADDQFEGRNEFGELDNAQDLLVYTGPGRWSSEETVSGDLVFGFPDGSDLFDLRGSGLQFAALTIVREKFQTTISSDRGTITIIESFGQDVFVDANDFLF